MIRMLGLLLADMNMSNMIFNWKQVINDDRSKLWHYEGADGLKAWITWYAAHPPDYNGFVWAGGYKVDVSREIDDEVYDIGHRHSRVNERSIYLQSFDEADKLASKWAEKLLDLM